MQQDTLNALSWMIAEEYLEMRIAIPKQSTPYGFYHDKVGIFTDIAGDSIAIHGSLNDSIQSSFNGEAFSVFKSWIPGQSEYWNSHSKRLEKLWNNNSSQFYAYPIPKIIKEKLIELRTSNIPPYNRDIKTKIDNSIYIPYDIKLKPYQETAIEKWFSSNCLGIFEMATGTGKTITALAAATKIYQSKGRIFLIVIVPYLHLIEQWKEVAKKFGFNPILCGSTYSTWKEDLRRSIQAYNLKVVDNECIITVNKTAANEIFTDLINNSKIDNIMIIGDEVHCLGSFELQKSLLQKYKYRLGLSATPRRWFDEIGTKAIFSYFGEPCFEFSLDQAIKEGFLVPYTYYPILVNLTEEEHAEYEIITKKILKLLNRRDSELNNEDTLKKLFLARARIISGAKNKLPALKEILSDMIKRDNINGSKTRDILIYCPPGNHREILKQVSQLDLVCHEFVSDVSSDNRLKILSEFQKGFYQALVAIKCLDEGLDVPSTKYAFILASSTNPREFIQRRGRILRTSNNKTEAYIYDFIVIPTEEMIFENNPIDIGILKCQLPRFAEFSSSSKNEFQSRKLIWDIANRLGILPLLDKKPWEIYTEILQNNEGDIYENYL